MTRKILLILFFPLISFFLSSCLNASAQSLYLSREELTKIISNRTFIVTATKENFHTNSHIYFSGDGKYTTLFPTGKVRATDKWDIDKKSNLCMRRTFRSGKSDINIPDDKETGDSDFPAPEDNKKHFKREKYVTSCGKVALAGPNSLTLYNENDEFMTTLQFVGNGNLLDRFAP